jgi:hypothetical protein
MTETGWLPPLVYLEDAGGSWETYLGTLYGWFRRDFVESKPGWPGKRVGLKRYPLEQGKEATFWHFISEGQTEAERTIDVRRCECIRWPRPTIEAYIGSRPVAGSRVVWWRNQRRNEWRYVIALPDFSYLVVMADRGEYVLPWTQYVVERERQREKYRKEYQTYWDAQKS